MLLRSYLTSRSFLVKYEDEQTNLFPVEAGVPQGSVLGPVLYTVYTSDQPLSRHTTTATYADDTASLASHDDPVMASNNLQIHLDKLQLWFRKWRIKVNESKSVHVTFTMRRETCPLAFLNNQLLQTIRTCKIPRNAFGQKTDMAKTHLYKTFATWFKTEKDILAYWQKI